MIEKKIKSATQCLYACAGIHVLTAAYGIFITAKVNNELTSMLGRNPELVGHGYSLSYVNSMNSFFVVLDVAAMLIAKELPQGKVWAWIGSIAVFLLSAGTWALPVAIVGLLMVLDARVRAEFTKKIDVAL